MRVGTPKLLGTGQEAAVEPGDADPLLAACTVLQEMLALKYRLQLDEPDFLMKAKARISVSDRASPLLLANALNSEPPFRVKDESGERLLQLELQVLSVTSFTELRSYIRRFPGTACAVATVASVGTKRPQVVAAFREAYGLESLGLVGRARSQLLGGIAPLVDFHQESFRSAVVFDPVVAKVLRYESASNLMVELQVPAVTSEYQHGVDPREDDHVASRACHLLSDLMFAGARHAPAGSVEAACDFCTDLMSSRLGSRSLQAAACRALGALLPETERYSRPAETGVEMIAAAMRRHAASPDVLEAAAWALSGSTAMRPDLQSIAATNGVSEEVVNAMCRFRGPDHAPLQRGACGAVAALVAGNPCLQATVAACKGIETVLAAMRQHADDVQLQRLACGALSNLAAKNPNNQTSIGALGGVQLVLGTLRRHLDSATVLQSALAAIWCLVKNNSEHQQRVLQEGGVELMVAAIQRHPEDETLKGLARGPLQALLPGLSDVLAAETGSPPATARRGMPQFSSQSPSSGEEAQGAAHTAPGAAVQGRTATNGQSTAKSKAEAALPLAAMSSPTRCGWALETIDEGSDSGGSPGSASAAAKPPGLTARGARRSSDPRVPAHPSSSVDLDSGRSKSK